MRQVDGGDKKGRLDGGDEFSVGDILLEWIKIEIRAAFGDKITCMRVHGITKLNTPC